MEAPRALRDAGPNGHLSSGWIFCRGCPRQKTVRHGYCYLAGVRSRRPVLPPDIPQGASVWNCNFASGNNDLGPLLPTFQERVNAMLPVNRAETAGQGAETAAAPALPPAAPETPHMLNTAELRAALADVEAQAQAHSRELAEVHSGLNAQRVARLLDLLE